MQEEAVNSLNTLLTGREKPVAVSVAIKPENLEVVENRTSDEPALAAGS
jgi:hypothetical protein